MALAVRYNEEPNGYLYGTHAFSQTSDINLSHYAHAGAACECALDSAVPSFDQCNDGLVYYLSIYNVVSNRYPLHHL